MLKPYTLLLSSCVIFSKAILAMPSAWQHPDSYIGAYFGGGFEYNQIGTNVGSVTDTSYFTSAADINAVNQSGASITAPHAVIAGIQAGHDWVYKKMVYGAVLDYGAMSLDASHTQNSVAYPSGSGQYTLHTAAQTNWLFTLRGRLGYHAALRWPSLFYVTGGMAITKFKINNTFSDNTALSGLANIQNNLYEIGWAIGLGIDVAALKKLSFDVEYLFVDMPSINTTSVIANSADGFGTPAGSQSSPFSTNNIFHANLLKIGLNYYFNS